MPELGYCALALVLFIRKFNTVAPYGSVYKSLSFSRNTVIDSAGSWTGQHGSDVDALIIA